MPAMHSEPADRGLFKNLASGIILGALSLAFSYFVGLRLLHDRYFVQWVAASITGFYILIAWLLWLRDDAFMKRRQTKPPRASSKRPRRVLLSASLFLALASFFL